MAFTVEADEVDNFVTAVAGLTVDYVRTDRGHGPSRTTCAGPRDAQLSVGSMGFSAIASTEVPSDLVVFSLITSAPPGSVWCGQELDVGQLYVYGPGTAFHAIEPAGLAATMLTVPTAAVEHHAQGVGDPLLNRSAEPLDEGEAVWRFRRFLRESIAQPTLMDDARWSQHVADAGMRVLLEDRAPRIRLPSRRLDSRTVVSDSIAFVEATRTFRPTMSELCRAACVSESRLRQAFVDVVGEPPNRYFQYRLLNRLRTQLVSAGPSDASVSSIATTLGVSHFSRLAASYKRAFNELPSETLNRTPLRRVPSARSA
ncbi:helix-turn-helix domain-containing protein [bacterium]|nr:helix-turn-helix domain-containing protein [bacterium]